jgi:TM2 domain-containing membrane protein YozV
MAQQIYVTPKSTTSEKSKMTAIILCLIGFLGIAGIHHFYVGKTGMGILYFFTIGFFFIGTLISIFSLLMGNFKDNTGALLK